MVGQVRRPEIQQRKRLRVEFRLPQDHVDLVYRCARDWDVSLSDAGARLLEIAGDQLRRGSSVGAGAVAGREEISP